MSKSQFASDYSSPVAVPVADDQAWRTAAKGPAVGNSDVFVSDAEKARAYRMIARQYARSAKLARKADLAQYRANSVKIRAETEANLITARIAKY